jgi:hypothetical protein
MALPAHPLLFCYCITYGIKHLWMAKTFWKFFMAGGMPV